MEVIAGMTLMTMLMVPTLGLLTASARIWRQFESGHDSVAMRQSTIQDVASRLDGAIRILSNAGTQIQYQAIAGDTQRLYQRGNQIFWEHAGRTDLIGDGIGALSFRQYLRGSTAMQGEVVEIRLQNATGSNVANAISSSLVWIKPTI